MGTRYDCTVVVLVVVVKRRTGRAALITQHNAQSVSNVRPVPSYRTDDEQERAQDNTRLESTVAHETSSPVPTASIGCNH